MNRPKFRKGWYVTNVTNGIKGVIEDIIISPRGIEYVIAVKGRGSGSTWPRFTFEESKLIKPGDQIMRGKK